MRVSRVLALLVLSVGCSSVIADPATDIERELRRDERKLCNGSTGPVTVVVQLASGERVVVEVCRRVVVYNQ